MDAIPEIFILPFLFVLGVIVGSFLNVVIYRLHTNRSLQGNSHCLSCGTKLSWYELIPLFSYLALHGTCAHCGARIPPRYLFVELLTGAAFMLAAVIAADVVLLTIYMVMFSVLIVILLYDLRHTIIPDEAVIALLVVAFLMVMWDPSTQKFLMPDMTALISATVGSMFYASLWYISKGRWIGLGDAKLAFPFGLILGWPLVVSLIVWSFWIGAAISLVIMGGIRISKALPRALGSIPLVGFVFPKQRIVNYTRYLTMKSEVPFAPFLIAAFLLVHVYGLDVFVVTAHLFGLNNI